MRDVVETFRATLDAASPVNVYLRGKVPNTPPASYFVLDVNTPRPTDYSHAAKSSSRSWTISTLYVGTSVDSCLFRAEEAEAAFLDKRLTLVDANCSPIKRAPGRTISTDPDVESVCSGSDLWSFVTTPA